MKTVSPSHSVDGSFRSTSTARVDGINLAFLSLFLLIADVYAYLWLAAFVGMGKWLWIFIEHAIGGRKRYKILVHVFRNKNGDFENDAVGICAGLWNFAPSC